MATRSPSGSLTWPRCSPASGRRSGAASTSTEFAQVEPRLIDQADEEIGGAARAKAADKTFGSIRRPGALRPVTRIDSLGRKTTAWHGDPFAWMVQFMPPTYDLLEMWRTGRGPMRRPGR